MTTAPDDDPLLDMFLLNQYDVRDIRHEYAEGDALAILLTRVLEQVVSGLKAMPRDEPILCVSCKSPIRQPGTFVLFVPSDQVAHYLSEPMAQTFGVVKGTGHIICPKCSRIGKEALRDRVVSGLRAECWPELRAFKISDQVGHA